MRTVSVRLVITCFCIVGLTGCAAMGVPYTSDPGEKLGWAKQLFHDQRRPLPAERLIREAIEIYQQQNDQLGLAEAYRTYGFFFRSAGVLRLEKHYRKNGFDDETATFDQRLAKSIEYFEKAKVIFTQHKQFDKLTNVYLVMAESYELMNDLKSACAALDQSLQSHLVFKNANPKEQFVLPSGYSSYEEYVASYRKSIACP